MRQVHWVWLFLQAIMIIDEAGSLGMAVPTSNHDNRQRQVHRIWLVLQAIMIIDEAG